MTHFFNNKQVLMENVSFQDPKALFYDLTEEEIKIIEEENK